MRNDLQKLAQKLLDLNVEFDSYTKDEFKTMYKNYLIFLSSDRLMVILPNNVQLICHPELCDDPIILLWEKQYNRVNNVNFHLSTLLED